MEKSNSAERQFHLLRRPFALLAAIVVCAIAAVNVSAQVVVVDPTNVATNQTGFATQLAKTIEQYRQQIAQFAKQVQQYELQLQQYQQMLSSIQNIPNSLTLASNQLRHVDNIEALVQGKCSGVSGAGGFVSSVMNSMSSLMSQSITRTQQMICEQIVITQIKKYNDTVDMLNKLHDEYGDKLERLDDIFRHGLTMADSGRASGQAEKFSGALATEMGNWQARMKAYDAVVETLQSQQSILGHVALNGSSTALGNIVRATTFAAAFH